MRVQYQVYAAWAKPQTPLKVKLLTAFTLSKAMRPSSVAKNKPLAAKKLLRGCFWNFAPSHTARNKGALDGSHTHRHTPTHIHSRISKRHGYTSVVVKAFKCQKQQQQEWRACCWRRHLSCSCHSSFLSVRRWLTHFLHVQFSTMACFLADV